jgi:hypothetical protein
MGPSAPLFKVHVTCLSLNHPTAQHLYHGTVYLWHENPLSDTTLSKAKVYAAWTTPELLRLSYERECYPVISTPVYAAR